MTKEEKEAIKTLKEHCLEHYYYDDETVFEAIEILLNLIQKQQKQLDDINSYIYSQGVDDKLKTATQIKVQNQHEYIQQCKVEKLEKIIHIKNRELEKKDKQIDKMIDNIMIHYQLKTIRKMCCPTCKWAKKCTYNGIHRECIKQYFEKKVEE